MKNQTPSVLSSKKMASKLPPQNSVSKVSEGKPESTNDGSSSQGTSRECFVDGQLSFKIRKTKNHEVMR